MRIDWWPMLRALRGRGQDRADREPGPSEECDRRIGPRPQFARGGMECPRERAAAPWARGRPAPQRTVVFNPVTHSLMRLAIVLLIGLVAVWATHRQALRRRAARLHGWTIAGQIERLRRESQAAPDDVDLGLELAGAYARQAAAVATVRWAATEDAGALPSSVAGEWRVLAAGIRDSLAVTGEEDLVAVAAQGETLLAPLAARDDLTPEQQTTVEVLRGNLLLARAAFPEAGACAARAAAFAPCDPRPDVLHARIYAAQGEYARAAAAAADALGKLNAWLDTDPRRLRFVVWEGPPVARVGRADFETDELALRRSAYRMGLELYHRTLREWIERNPPPTDHPTRRNDPD